MKENYSFITHFSQMVRILTACLLLTACTGHRVLAPVVDREQPPTRKINHHTVAHSETLYSIAWRYNLDITVLAAINGLREPYIIRPGQVINLDPSQTPARVTVSQSSTHQSNSVKIRSKSQPRTAPEPVVVSPQNAQLKWQWPSKGIILAKFAGPQSLNKGIDIAGKKGEPVLAAESGTVVYAGSGIRGYGKLLIVKHDRNYLSAYAHNDKLLAAEGDSVKAGQQIAEIGSTGTTRDKLHFELRLEGKPVDPLKYLPSR